MGSDSGAYQKVGDPSDVTQINPKTDQFWNMLFGGGGMEGYLKSSMAGALSGVPEDRAAIGNLINEILSKPGYNPQSGINAFLGAVPELQGIARNTVSPYGLTADELATQQSNAAMSQVSQQYSNMGAINSGAAVSAMTRGAAVPRAQLAADLARTQAGAATSLIGQAMQVIPNQYSQAYQFGQNQQQMGLRGYGGLLNSRLSEAGLYSGLLGSVYGAGGQMAAPQYYTPTYMGASDNSWNWGGALGGGVAGAGTGATAGFMMGGPVGAGVGAGVGGLIGFFGGGL